MAHAQQDGKGKARTRGRNLRTTVADGPPSKARPGQKTVAAGAFKARCLALLDEVQSSGQSLVVTKRGRPVAKVVPVEQPRAIDGSVLECDDILAPAIREEDWNMLEGQC